MPDEPENAGAADWDTLLGRMERLAHGQQAGLQVLKNVDQRVAINATLLAKILRAVTPDEEPDESGLEAALKAIVARLDQIEKTLRGLTAAIQESGR